MADGLLGQAGAYPASVSASTNSSRLSADSAFNPRGPPAARIDLRSDYRRSIPGGIVGHLLRPYTRAVSAARLSAMNMSRRWRFITAILSLCALLFTQTALAAYACGGAVKALQVAQMTEADMPCAASMSKSMDDEQPALCHAHCQSTPKSADNLQPPPLATVAQLGPVLTIKPASRPELTSVVVQASLLRPSASPPLAISHCCFRN